MTNEDAKLAFREQLIKIGVELREVKPTFLKHIANGCTEIEGKSFEFELCERIRCGIQISTPHNNKKLILPYETMCVMANAMGLFDEVQDE
ncbi:hypothetical protein MHD_10125 [Mannheimia granulomatis]|uniref:Uncharacterized protein n=1 Tax=Mannheimia granulomatis TaxID=85402 RepID=A0A011ND72_9PAST|nr:hypothetical protein [Mannheimia granulomatis]EXI62385.1 hypothetical protein AK33_05590 [Mannheimia granulomatis]RGE47394.1 hypothetical protein MHD_10125 [Mannheimia granulomatis]